MTDLPEGVHRFVESGQARFPSTARLFDYWRNSRRDGIPIRRTEIDPVALRDVLPFLLLGDIEPAPFRVLFRLVGTAVAAFHDIVRLPALRESERACEGFARDLMERLAADGSD